LSQTRRLRCISPAKSRDHCMYHGSSSAACSGGNNLSKWPNCFHGTCSGLVIWQPRCTADALSETRHVMPIPFSCLKSAVVTLIGGVNHIMPVLSMTHASVLAPVPFPQLNLPIRSYCPITPNPCTLGQQVTIIVSSYCSHCTSCPYCPDHS